ncbi:hypothetical protein I3842_09G212000 [Carya illinoinensis]|uniref:Uncharacterized protein n=1 Tax=Carya illinoinensis TaxID=32201 RepID=A0A922E6E7_CARIL|nr:hypothetical protein I3842_09G212000 [Carya illinoinensis]
MVHVFQFLLLIQFKKNQNSRIWMYIFCSMYCRVEEMLNIMKNIRVQNYTSCIFLLFFKFLSIIKSAVQVVLYFGSA